MPAAGALVRREDLRRNPDAATRQTLARMAELVDRRASDPAVRQLALEIVREAPPRDVRGQIARLRSFLARHTRFVADPVQDELLIDPARLLGEIATTGAAYGDCDDVAILAATLGQAIGIPARFQVVSFDRGPMAHVWTELADGGAWHELDVTRPPAVRPLSVARRWTVPLYLAGGARAGVTRRTTLGEVVTVGGVSIDLDKPAWLGLDTRTWLYLAGGGLVLLLVLRR